MSVSDLRLSSLNDVTIHTFMTNN